jgi:AraC-like DNA-binding protein
MSMHPTKINLLAEMIAFSVVDGELHEREYQFLCLVACELNISKKELNDLFHQEHSVTPIKSETQRIQQFYRLVLLMHIDDVLYEKEAIAIKQIAIEMGLNPSATNRFLELIRTTKNRIIEPYEAYALFHEQRN